MKRPTWAIPTLIDATLIATSLADSLLYLHNTSPSKIVLALAASFGLSLRRRWPWASLLIALPSLVFVSASIASLVALYSVSVTTVHRWTIAIASLITLAGMSSTWWGPTTGGDTIVSLIYAVMSAAAPVALGLLVRTRRELIDRLVDLEQARESERKRAAEKVLATERSRIAREMHDVVSHQVSLLAVQAGALQVANVDPEIKTTARTMRSLAVKTLDELRQMVSVLRANGTNTGQIAPQPTIADLPELITNSGIPATTMLELPKNLPASMQRAIYRTIQEALTNIRKHAPGATATITGRAKNGEITVTVQNTQGTEASMRLPSSGHGLIGLRERAELLGGSLTAKPQHDSGFSITLTIPTP